ncbi:MAG: DNA polymerase IV [Alphaproteobacteria bacterium]|nr:DNA polymerase IV [Alphaproteobacteria bacterium]
MSDFLCKDCGNMGNGTPPPHCPACGSPRLRAHPELRTLAIAHVDADAFYANIEKRDDPALKEKPVLVGGGLRGVVVACCYVARRYGVRSAMPMFKARRLCPEAVVIAPDFEKYRQEGGRIRALMLATTPLVEPVSIDEAYLDLSGTERLHGGPPARTLALLTKRIKATIGVTVSIGLSYNKFLAKIASDLDKPCGFAVIGRAEAEAFLADKPVTILPGVGEALARRLLQDAIATVGDLQRMPVPAFARYGAMGRHLAAFSRGEDDRPVEPDAETKSVGAETTFVQDLQDADALACELWPLCETVARRLKAAEKAAAGISLKLKTADFKQRTRARRFADPTVLSEKIYQAARILLKREADGTQFRLIGVTAEPLVPLAAADPPDLFPGGSDRQARIERTMDDIRAKPGVDAIVNGRSRAVLR